MAYLRESFAYAGRVLRTLTPANAMEPTVGPYPGPSTRLGLATISIWHATDHYGQLVVYLRMNGIVPPASAQCNMRIAGAHRAGGRERAPAAAGSAILLSACFS